MTRSTNKAVHTSLQLAEYDLPVYPVPPRSKGGYKGTLGKNDATTEEHAIYTLFENLPEANIGVFTGGDNVVNAWVRLAREDRRLAMVEIQSLWKTHNE